MITLQVDLLVLFVMRAFQADDCLQALYLGIWSISMLLEFSEILCCLGVFQSRADLYVVVQR